MMRSLRFPIKALSKVVLPLDVGPEITMVFFCSTADSNNCACSLVSMPLATKDSREENSDECTRILKLASEQIPCGNSMCSRV